jgi:hypothetical protein
MTQIELFPTSEILTEPPEDEGDNSEAGGGKPTEPVSEDELEDADDLDDDEQDDESDG